METKVVFFIICYNNENEVYSFIEQLSKQKRQDEIEVVVTVNSSIISDDLELKLKQLDIISHIIYPNKNMGYINGCLYGLSKTFSEKKFDWGIICNTDITICDDDLISKIEKYTYDTDIAGIGPCIRLPEGKPQNPFLLTCPSIYEVKMIKAIFSNYYLFRLYFFLSNVKGKVKKNKQEIKTGIVYSIHGSFMILNSEILRSMMMDEIKIFLFGEEEYIAGVVREHGKCIIYDDSIKIIHNEHQTIGKIDYRKKQKWYRQSIDFLSDRIYHLKRGTSSSQVNQ